MGVGSENAFTVAPSCLRREETTGCCSSSPKGDGDREKNFMVRCKGGLLLQLRRCEYGPHDVLLDGRRCTGKSKVGLASFLNTGNK